MKAWLIGALAFVLSFAAPAPAPAQDSQIYIDVGQAQVKKSLLAFTPLIYVGSQSTNRAHIDAGQELYRVMYNDLAVSGFFTFIKPEAYLEDPNTVGVKPAPGAANGFNMSKWKTIGTEFLTRTAYQVLGNEISMETYVYHVPTARLVMGKSYKGPVSAARKMAHTFANDLVQALTGKRAMFGTKIVASRQDAKASIKEIYMMDWDGANAQKITSHASIAISPAWSTKGNKIAYTAFAFHKAEKVRNADMFIYEIASGKRFLVSYRKGINSGAAFMPGDANMLLTLSQEGSPDIYRMTVDGSKLTRLTNGPNRSMNVEPAVSPDGKQIAFSSDRLGRPMIFVMNADGSGVKRLTFAGKYNSTPAWSPDGKSLAFAALDVDHFDIFTMRADGSGLKRLTDARKTNGRAANNESPSWSPDGRHVLFTSDRTGKYQLYVIAPDGTNERRITEDNYNWDKPKWSPFLD
ncbi:MAG TPA: translocation protein TolB [Bdellovibrionales bacterium]|nr:translocation protein TolB [Bdellovibrionales bacterium]